MRPNKEVAEFIIDLSNILKSRLPTMAQEDRCALIGVAMAGAKLYIAGELTKAAEGRRDLIGRIRQKLVLAENSGGAPATTMMRELHSNPSAPLRKNQNHQQQ